jgi:hypothetical protein
MVAQSVWWIASIVELQSDFLNYIDNLEELDRSTKRNPEEAVTAFPRDLQEECRSEPTKNLVHPDRRIHFEREGVAAQPDEHFDMASSKAKQLFDHGKNRYHRFDLDPLC